MQINTTTFWRTFSNLYNILNIILWAHERKVWQDRLWANKYMKIFSWGFD